MRAHSFVYVVVYKHASCAIHGASCFANNTVVSTTDSRLVKKESTKQQTLADPKSDSQVLQTGIAVLQKKFVLHLTNIMLFVNMKRAGICDF